MSHRLATIAVLALFANLIATCARAEEKKPEQPFFPIMAWDGPTNDVAYLKRMRDCGFTVAGFVPAAALDNCHDAGLKAIVSEPATRDHDWRNVDATKIRPTIAELIGKTRNHPAVFGYYLRDEPPAGMFPGLAKVAEVVRELHPGVWPYINLFPTYATPDQLETKDYEAYLERFIETCKPPILSYDHYALMEGGGFNEAYFTNLDIMRRVAFKHGIPFWNIAQSLGALNFREPTHTDLRFQAYTSLAYGCRGIAWFQYRTSNTGNFRGSPVDGFGNETQSWKWMQNVNLQIQTLAPTLLKCKSDRVYHIGAVPPGCSASDKDSLVKSIPGNILVGDFTHEDRSRYVLIVNKSFTASTWAGPIQLNVPVKKLEYILATSGQLLPFEGEGAWLAPGQGALIKLTK